MVKAYFCWEVTVGRRWKPVLYADKPGKAMEYAPERSPIHEVEVSSHEDMSPMSFVKQYPAPPQTD